MYITHILHRDGHFSLNFFFLILIFTSGLGKTNWKFEFRLFFFSFPKHKKLRFGGSVIQIIKKKIDCLKIGVLCGTIHVHSTLTCFSTIPTYFPRGLQD